MPQIIRPRDEAHWLALRTEDITSTESAALFGLHPRLTHYELYQRKRGAYDVPFEPTERTKWGTRLEAAIAAGVAEDYAVKIRRASYYARHNKTRLGASFDYEVVGINSKPDDYLGNLVELYEQHGTGVLEVKNVDALVFLSDWLVERDEDGNKEIEAPAYIELQLQHQLEVVNRDWGAIATLVGGNRPIVITRRRDRDVGKSLVEHAGVFWKRVDAGQEPQPDFKRDADVIAKIYGYAEPGKLFDARGNERIEQLAREYIEHRAIEKNATEEKQARKAELLTLIGEAEKVLTNAATVSAGLIGPWSGHVERQGYRNFKVTPKKKSKVAA